MITSRIPDPLAQGFGPSRSASAHAFASLRLISEWAQALACVFALSPEIHRLVAGATSGRH